VRRQAVTGIRKRYRRRNHNGGENLGKNQAALEIDDGTMAQSPWYNTSSDAVPLPGSFV